MLSRAVAEGDSCSERCRWYSVVVLHQRRNAQHQLTEQHSLSIPRASRVCVRVGIDRVACTYSLCPEPLHAQQSRFNVWDIAGGISCAAGFFAMSAQCVGIVERQFTPLY